jgi:hypothetical protein
MSDKLRLVNLPGLKFLGHRIEADELLIEADFEIIKRIPLSTKELKVDMALGSRKLHLYFYRGESMKVDYRGDLPNGVNILWKDANEFRVEEFYLHLFLYI